MSGFLQIEIDIMRSELETFANACDIFEDYVNDGFKEEIGLAENMQSDFTPKLKDILENMHDKNMPDTLANMKAFHTKALEIVDTLQKDVDEEMAQKIGGK